MNFLNRPERWALGVWDTDVVSITMGGKAGILGLAQSQGGGGLGPKPAKWFVH